VDRGKREEGGQREKGGVGGWELEQVVNWRVREINESSLESCDTHADNVLYLV
jgi:hypothetical protein